jgi:hypothetical protein
MNPQNAHQHPVRTICHRVKQDAQHLLRRDFIVCPVIAITEVASALLALIALFTGNNTIFNRTYRKAL